VRISAHSVASAFAVLVLYVAAVVWLTWPLALGASTHLPDPHPERRFDTLYMAWVLSYESHTLTTDPARLRDTNIFHPARDTLFYGDTGFGALPYFMPVFLATGNPSLALDTMMLGSFALTATMLHLVVRRFTGSHLAGVVAASVLLLDRWLLWDFVPNAPSYAVLQYFPLIVLLAAAPARRLGDALRLLPFIALQCLTDVVYVATALMVPLGLLALVRLARPATRAAGVRLLTVLALAVALLVPLYAQHRAVALANPRLAEQTNFPGLAEPALSLPWGLVGFWSPLAVPLAAFALIGVGALVARLASASGPRLGLAWRHGLLWTVVGLAMMLTPTIVWRGQTITLPTAWLGIHKYLRVPTRLGVAALFGIAILTGVAFAECAARARRAGRLGPGLCALVVLVAMGFEYRRGLGPALRDPLPASYPVASGTVADSPVMDALRAPGGPVLQLPVGPAGGVLPTFHARAMYRSIFHWRRLVNGYSSYWPAGFAERMALATALPDPRALAALRRETGVALLLVDAGFMRVGRDAWLDLASRGGRDDLRLVTRDGDGLLLFEVRDAGPSAGAPG